MQTIWQQQGETTCFLPGRTGQLEAIVTCPPSHDHRSIAIVCHPDPLQQGTMHNKVVTTLAKTAHQLGLCSIRFNYRGVGQSEGCYADGIGEADDVGMLIDMIYTQQPQASIWLFGFSFGAYVAYRAAWAHAIKRIVLVAPPVYRFDFVPLSQTDSQCWVMQGLQDEVVPPHRVLDWAEHTSSITEMVSFKEAGHFFHGHLIHLKQQLMRCLSDYIRP